MKVLRTLLFLVLLLITTISFEAITKGCNRIVMKLTSKSVVKAASKTSARSASKTATKNSSKIIVEAGDITLEKNSKLIKPKPNVMTRALERNEVSGSATAKRVVPVDAIELKVLNSSGSTISKLPSSNSTHMNTLLQSHYRKEFVTIVDNVFSDITKKQITSIKQLDEEIFKAVKAKVGHKKSFRFDLSSGKLTYEMESFGMSGSINIIQSIKDGLIIGGGGYYIVKEINNDE